MAHLTIAPASALDVVEFTIKNHPDVIQDILFSFFVVIQVHSILCRGGVECDDYDKPEGSYTLACPELPLLN